MAIRLSKAFGGSTESWLIQQSQYGLWQVMQKEGEIKVKAFAWWELDWKPAWMIPFLPGGWFVSGPAISKSTFQGQVCKCYPLFFRALKAQLVDNYRNSDISPKQYLLYPCLFWKSKQAAYIQVMIGFPMRSHRGEEQGKRAPLNYFTLPLNGAKEPGEKNKTNEPAVSCRHLKTYQPECGHKKACLH